MITHRPVTGSLRSSDICCECVHIHFDSGRAAQEVYRDHVEPARCFRKVVPRQVVGRHPRNPALFPRGDRSAGTAKTVMPPRLHLDEDEHRPMTGDDVNLAISRAMTTGKNDVPAATQLLAREILAHFSECLTDVPG